MVDAADIVDHEKLQHMGDVEQDQVEADEHLTYLHNGHYTQVGDGTKQYPAESTRQEDNSEEFTSDDYEAVYIWFYLVKKTT